LEREDGELGFIADEIGKTGYPLEIHASEVLEKRGWSVLHSTFYQDIETGSMREIDIRADKSIDGSRAGDTISPHRLQLRLDIQCKKSDAVAWVFFLTTRRTQDMAPSPRFLDYLYVAKTTSLSRLYSTHRPTIPAAPTLSLGIAKSLKHVGDLGLIDRTTFQSLASAEQAKTYKEIKRKQAHDSKNAGEYPAIYEAAMTVLKATDYDFNNVYAMMQMVIDGSLSGVPLPRGVEIGDIQLYMPIILFEGKLVTWQDGHVKNANEVLLQSQVLSKMMFIPSPSIVVIHKDHLNDFLKSIDDDLLALADRIHENRGKLDEQLRSLKQQFASTDNPA
jgi:hypothetical protein